MRELAAVLAMEGTPVGELSIGGKIVAVAFPLAVALLGAAVVTDYRGFATWHRNRSQRDAPTALRPTTPTGPEKRDRATAAIQKIVGWWFMVLGTAMTVGMLVGAVRG
ncbi:hypothetical protein [Streptomyces sp. YS-3]|uniref:hypothetical protein n=1 Tax=Streptomyces sp. YS-3 TaxID=3381352 RepID=UPI00386253DB